MRKILKICSLLLAASLLAAVLFFGNAFLGNPVSWVLANRAVKDHLAANYPEMDIYINRFGYSFKSTNYFAHIRSQSSPDTEFYLYADMLGNVTHDSYDSWVLSGHTTETRIREEYRLLTKTVLESNDFPYHLEFGGGNLIVEGDWEVGTEPIEGLPREELVLDKQYDIKALGADYGELNLYIMDDTVTIEKAAEMVLGIRKLFDEAGVPFRFLDLTLRHVHDKDYQRPDGEIYACLSYEGIYEDGITQRVRSSHNAKIDYYARLDEENSKGLYSDDSLGE